MVKSMTGYGSAVAENENLYVQVEIKSLNSKFLDLSIRVPKEYAEKELEIRNLFTQVVERGKVSLSIEVKQKNDNTARVNINLELLKAYYDKIKAAAEYVGASSDDIFRTVLNMPKVIESDIENVNRGEEWGFVAKAMKDALAQCDKFRTEEGDLLKEKFIGYILFISEKLKEVEAHDPIRIQQVRDRIKNHLEEYVGKERVDQSRFEQELIYYIEKLDISEEKVRLKKHLDYFIEAMKDKEASGKKLGFLAQEIGREINTIGSKCNDADIQRSVIGMKEELEKIKEQLLNIL
ncbi:MAG: hypothetical protein JWM14_93 [Chitinophagaceae bacterium]|nr:hypothetical protein [Chitinophagaceae bacterium]